MSRFYGSLCSFDLRQSWTWQWWWLVLSVHVLMVCRCHCSWCSLVKWWITSWALEGLSMLSLRKCDTTIYLFIYLFIHQSTSAIRK